MQILIADSHDQVRFALRVMLSRQPGLQVVGEAADGPELIAQVKTTMPDLALVDWKLPRLIEAGGPEALHDACPKLRIVVLSSQPDVRRVVVRNGVDAFVSKGDPPENLLAVIRQCDGTRKGGGGDVTSG
jgi:DNA-binding NarL/FixJ family response regulator